MQLIVVRLLSQFFLRVVRGVEAERLCTDSGKLDASAIQLDIIAIIVTAVLLRANVVLVLLPDGGTEVVVAGSMVLVAVAFHRTHAEVTDAGHFFWQEQAQAKARQFGEYRVALSVQCQRYCTAAGNRPADIQIKEFLQADRCNADFGAQSHTAVRHLIFGAVGVGHTVVIAGSQPIQLQLAVIIRRSTPDVELHFLVQQDCILVLHRGEQTRQLIKAVGKVLTAQRQMAVRLLNSDCAVGRGITPHSQGFLVAAVFVFQQDFIKTQEMTFRTQGQVFIAMVEDFQETLAFIGNMDGQRQGVFAVRRQGETVRVGDEAAVDDLAVAAYLIG